MITSGEGKYKVFLQEKHIGKDRLYILTGGEQPHLGGVVLCRPDEQTKVISHGTHKDHVVLTPLAEHACTKYNTTIIAVGGIHINNATQEEIEQIQKNCKELESCI